MFVEKMKETILNLKVLNERFKGASPEEILLWSVDKFQPDLAMTTSFQISGVVIMHMLSRINRSIPIIFIDTGFHFAETLSFRNKMIKEFNLDIITLKPEISKEELKRKYGNQLYNTDPDLCCHINKVEPQKKFLKESNIKYLISGLRKDQGLTRANHDYFMFDYDGYIHLHPLINWNWYQVWDYIHQYKLPYLSLYDHGYTSIGCYPVSCTSKNTIENGERNGRWKDYYKKECGLHNELIIGEGKLEYMI